MQRAKTRRRRWAALTALGVELAKNLADDLTHALQRAQVLLSLVMLSASGGDLAPERADLGVELPVLESARAPGGERRLARHLLGGDSGRGLHRGGRGLELHRPEVASA